MMRPRGYPPMPSAISRPMLPEGTTSTLSAMEQPSFRRMMAPLPYSFSMLATARSTALPLFCQSSFFFLGSSMGLSALILRICSDGKRGVRPGVKAGLSALFLALGGCDKEPPPPKPADPPPVASFARALGIDAGELEPSVDPPAPAGDLKAELAAFTTVDACVAQRAAGDPVVGD